MPNTRPEIRAFVEEMRSTRSGRFMLEALDCLPNGFVIYDPTLHLIYGNQVARDRNAQMFELLEAGVPLDQIVRRQLKLILPDLPPDEFEESAEDYIYRLRTGLPVEFHTENGRTAQSNFFEMESGERVAVTVDITAIRANEQRLRLARSEAEAANKTKSAFLANTSHEIRTPLNGILGLTEHVLKLDLPTEARQHLNTIHDAGTTLLTLLNDILDLSKIEAGAFELAPDEKALSETVGKVERLWSGPAKQKGLSLDVVIGPGVPEKVIADHHRLYQCLSNLVSNAIKFTEEGSVHIRVDASKPKAGQSVVTVAVSDTGPGISDDIKTQLFKPFTQADSSTSRTYGGTGLGLSIVQGLMDLMGGSVDLESKVGVGTTFRVRLPVKVPGEIHGPKPQTAVHMRSIPAGLKVLIVDDIGLNRQVARLLLQSSGCVCSEAENGQEALDMLAGGPIDIVLMDLHMPTMDGFEAVRRIRESSEAWGDVPVIALSADEAARRDGELGEKGFNGFIAKPVSEARLLEAISDVLNGENYRNGRVFADIG
ncbi:ATP-binding protein [Parvularcula bermudensis]|nr:ATP-binding protein [Parvularcula bermudensis]